MIQWKSVSSFVVNIGLLAGQNLFLAYFIIYLATIFLGNISAFTSFWIVSQGYLGAWGIPLLALTLFLSDLTGDILWYSLGHTTRGTRFGEWLKRRLPWHAKIEQTLTRNGRGLILLSKFVYASAFPVIFSVGWTKMPFKKFFRSSVLSILLWLPILLGLAYGLTSGLSPLRAISVFRKFEFAFFIGLGLFLFSDYFLAKMFSRLFEKKNGAEDVGG